jgi:hypothetical protein
MMGIKNLKVGDQVAWCDPDWLLHADGQIGKTRFDGTIKEIFTNDGETWVKLETTDEQGEPLTLYCRNNANLIHPDQDCPNCLETTPEEWGMPVEEYFKAHIAI